MVTTTATYRVQLSISFPKRRHHHVQGWFVPVSNRHTLEPVSYTHLDVYKRQVQYRRPKRGMSKDASFRYPSLTAHMNINELVMCVYSDKEYNAEKPVSYTHLINPSSEGCAVNIKEK